jgi:hypothetical protein
LKSDSYQGIRFSDADKNALAKRLQPLGLASRTRWLKPVSNLAAVSALLKACPDTSLFSNCTTILFRKNL